MATSAKGSTTTARKRSNTKAADSKTVSAGTQNTSPEPSDEAVTTAQAESTSVQSTDHSVFSGEARYPLDELIQHAGYLFGVKPEVMHGVFHAASGQTFTIDEVNQQIQQFMKAKVE
ncbi:hypothetical protein [Paenibacillus sp. WLX2291]|uniref:hypothetical protein n=1 Tax=Paenibacillus sp. WLX2291 TaxID=3296934 RepID=UPI0039840F73